MVLKPQAGLQRKPGISLYYQVAEFLRDQILSGKLRPGERLPTEEELCDMFQVSRTTVRHALGLLASEGLIYRRQGQGTYVAEPSLERVSPQLLSFTEEMSQKGLRPGSKVLALEKIPADEKVGEKLRIRPGEPVIRIKRLRLANGEPMGVQTAHIPFSICPGILEEDLSQSLYDLLENKYGIALSSATDTYYVGVVNEEEARLLRVPPGSAAFVVERVTMTSTGMPVEYVRSVMRGDRYRVSLQLKRQKIP